MTVNVYDIGDLVSLTGRFYSDAALTIPADPTTAVLTIRDPLRVITTPTVAHPGTGVYTYAWTPTTAGLYEVNWTGTGAVQSVDQETVQIKVGITVPSNLYLTLPQLKAASSMQDTSFADGDMVIALGAASRAIDSITGRRFWLDANANQVRYYTPRSLRLLQIDDLVVMTSVAIDRGGTGTWAEAWTNGTQYVLEPFNAPQEQPARPYETLRVRYLSGLWLPTWIEQSVKVTGQFGWSTVPDDVTAATGIIASKLLLRARSAPFGIVTAGIDQGVAMRIGRTDPDVFMLLRDYNRHELMV